VQVGSVNASMFAIVADGLNGLKIIQLISPENVPGHMGFSPKPNPKFIATYHTKGAALAVSRGLDRDRVVDESGGQTVVFGRRGSGPFSLDEMKVFFRKRSNGEYGEESLERNGDFYKVADIKRGTNGDLLDHHGAVLEPDDEFKMPESALDDDDEETPNNSGSTKRRRAPKNLRE
jgi:hypothetical protein